MRFAIKVSLSVLVIGVCTEALQGAIWCMNVPADAFFTLGAISVPLIAGAAGLWLTRIWRHKA